MGNGIEQRPRRVGRLELGIEVRPACGRDDRGAPLTHLGVDQPARTVEPAGGDTRDRGRLGLTEIRRIHAEPVANGALGEPPERDELAARADRLRDRPELVGDEHDRRVERRLLQILQQRIGSVVVEQVSGEQEVHAAVRLERPQVQVVVELADDVDADHVAERLDDPEVRVSAFDDASRRRRAGRPRTRTRPRLADAGWAVEEERVCVAVGERGGEQPLRLGLLRNRCEGLHGSPRRAALACPSRRRPRSGPGTRSASSGSPRRPAVEAVVLALDPVALAAHAADGIVDADLEQDRAVGHQAVDGGKVEREHALEPEAAGDALVGDRRVDVAVADHRRPRASAGRMSCSTCWAREAA